ncbi:MAG: hypothetical protein FWH19_06270 [Treponema sp.]|nr:hypothetical protein [Treponema sp.]
MDYGREKRLPILTNRLVIFFFCLCLFGLLLYAAGTGQGFADATQYYLLSFYLILGLLLALASALAMVVEMRRFIISRKLRYFLRAGIYLLLLGFGAASFFLAMFIVTISRGIGL